MALDIDEYLSAYIDRLKADKGLTDEELDAEMPGLEQTYREAIEEGVGGLIGELLEHIRDNVAGVPLSGRGEGDNSGWSVIGRVRFADSEFGDSPPLKMRAECEASSDGVPGEVALYDVTDADTGSVDQIGDTQTVDAAGAVEVTIEVPGADAPDDARIFELRAQVDGGSSGDKVIVWNSWIDVG